MKKQRIQVIQIYICFSFENRLIRKYINVPTSAWE